MKAMPVMKLNIDDDPENANWLHQMRNKKKTKKVLSPKIEEIKQLALRVLDEYNKSHSKTTGEFTSSGGGGGGSANTTTSSPLPNSPEGKAKLTEFHGEVLSTLKGSPHYGFDTKKVGDEIHIGNIGVYKSETLILKTKYGKDGMPEIHYSDRKGDKVNYPTRNAEWSQKDNKFSFNKKSFLSDVHAGAEDIESTERAMGIGK